MHTSENGTAWLGSRGDIEAVTVDASAGATISGPAASTMPGSEASTSAAIASGSSSNHVRVLLVGRPPAAGDKVRLLSTRRPRTKNIIE